MWLFFKHDPDQVYRFLFEKTTKKADATNLISHISPVKMEWLVISLAQVLCHAGQHLDSLLQTKTRASAVSFSPSASSDSATTLIWPIFATRTLGFAIPMAGDIGNR